MRTAIRVTALAGLVGYFSLAPETTHSLTQDPQTHLSNWHPADEVPCLMWLYTKDIVTGIEGCECVTLFEQLEISSVEVAR
ncbi:hypothetical protein N9448_08630 [Litorivicinus sp.]|nr:hypothetical protein [Litorivicinus sp.]